MDARTAEATESYSHSLSPSCASRISPSGGTYEMLTVNSNSDLIYTPQSGFRGTAEFHYFWSDDERDINPSTDATVSKTVEAQAFPSEHDTEVSVTVGTARVRSKRSWWRVSKLWCDSRPTQHLLHHPSSRTVQGEILHMEKSTKFLDSK